MKGISRVRALAFVRIGLASSLLALLAGVANAQDTGPSDSEMSLARELFRQGVAAVDANRWPEAYDAFSRAYALVPRPLVLLNLAGAQARTGRLVASAESYRRFLREASNADEARMRPAAEQALRELEPRIPRLRIAVDGLVEGDVVTLDGQPLSAGALDAPLPVDPGPHTVRVVRSGTEVAAARRDVIEGAVASVSLRAPAPPPLPREAWTPGARQPVLAPTRAGSRARSRDRSRDRGDEGGSVLSSPVFWVVTVLVVGGGVTAGVWLATSGDEAQPIEPPTPFSGTLPPGRFELR